MNDELKTYKLRVPSQMELVTVVNVRKFVGILHQLPDKFENMDITNIKEFPLNNEEAISRLLSYFKYLGVITEERVKEIKEGKKINKQYFYLTDVGKELKKTALYEPDNINNKWIECLQKSELFKALTENEEYQNWHQVSRTNIRKMLGESFSKKVKDAKERIDSAEGYLINFVKEFNLFTYDGTYLKPVGETSIVSEKSVQEIPSTTESEGIKESIEKESIIQPSKGFTYIKDDDFELKIKLNPLSLQLLKKQIEILDIKIESMTRKESTNKSEEQKSDKETNETTK
jgi:hypothetical protein